MRTLLLDNALWDLCLDASANIAVANDPYAIAQDVASAIRLFLGELWYDTTAGVPYFEEILGQAGPLQIFKNQMIAAALTVPQVTGASCFISAFKDRVLSGQVQVTFDDTVAVVFFNGGGGGFTTSIGVS